MNENTEKSPNYTPEMFETMKELYLANPTRETVDLLADKYDKTVRSIVGKLSKEGIYKKPSYVNKRGEAPVTKEVLVGLISDTLGGPLDAFDGLEKAPKTALKRILLALDPAASKVFQIPK